MDWYEKIYSELLAINPDLAHRSKCTIDCGERKYIFLLYHDYKQAEYVDSKDFSSIQVRKLHLFFQKVINLLKERQKGDSCVY